MTSIFLDTNVFMYALGRPHALKEPSIQVLNLAAQHEGLFTSAEVMQELLHRYISRRRWPAMKPRVDLVFELMESRVADLIVDDTQQAGSMALSYSGLAARDLVHLAVMQRVGSTHIVTADRTFDGIDGVTRLDPARVDEWQSLITGN